MERRIHKDHHCLDLQQGQSSTRSGQNVQVAGRDRPRRHMEHLEAWVLSFDVGGPFAPGLNHDRAYPKYVLCANLTISVLNGLPLIAGWRPKEGELQTGDQPDELDFL